MPKSVELQTPPKLHFVETMELNFILFFLGKVGIISKTVKNQAIGKELSDSSMSIESSITILSMEVAP